VRSHRTSQPRRLIAFLIAACPVIVGCGPQRTGPAHPDDVPRRAAPLGKTLKMTVVPYEAADKLQDDYGLMATYLAKKLGKSEGKFFAVADYPGVIAALKNGQVDVAYLSSLPYALAQDQMQVRPLASPWVKGKPDYHGIIFVRQDSPIKTVADLKGRTVAFGDTLSTTGYLLPRTLLESKGVPLTSLKRWNNAGDAQIVVRAVETGAADAGCSYEQVFEVVYRDHPEKAAKMRVIDQTVDIPNGLYVARGDLPNEEVEALRKAFMEMNTDPLGRAAMLRAPNDKIVPPPDEKAFDVVREAAKGVGLELGKLRAK
jgi:phosphonate transport system substrate-binding protein